MEEAEFNGKGLNLMKNFKSIQAVALLAVVIQAYNKNKEQKEREKKFSQKSLCKLGQRMTDVGC